MFPQDKVQPIIFTNPMALVALLLFGSFIVALLCYIWAFCSQRHKLPAFKDFLHLFYWRRTRELRGAQHIYYTAFFLLLFDGLTLIFGIIFGILMFCGQFDWFFQIFCTIWIDFRTLSQSQHLITALVSILFAYNPLWRGGLLDASKALNLLPILLIILSLKIHDRIIIGVDVYNFFLVVGIIVTWCRSSNSPIANQRMAFGLMSVLFYIICLPMAVLNCLIAHSDHYLPLAVDVLFFTNFYIVMNPLLFRLVLKMEDGNQSDNPPFDCEAVIVKNQEDFQ